MDWETARCAHVWIDPQRINYVINPSFRGRPVLVPVGLAHQRHRTAAQVSGGINRIDLVAIDNDTGPAVPGGEAIPSCLYLVGASPIVLESNYFPDQRPDRDLASECRVSGTGRFRIGIVYFQTSMAEEDAIYFATPWQTFTSGSASQTDFHRIYASLPVPDTTKEGVVRIEFQGTECWVDEVLAAPEDGTRYLLRRHVATRPAR